MARRAQDWRWSSARAHLAGRDDDVVRLAPLLDRVADWRSFLDGPTDDETLAALRWHARTVRPLGSASWLEALEAMTDHNLVASIDYPRGHVRADQARVRPQRLKRPLGWVCHCQIGLIRGGTRPGAPVHDGNCDANALRATIVGNRGEPSGKSRLKGRGYTVPR